MVDASFYWFKIVVAPFLVGSACIDWQKPVPHGKYSNKINSIWLWWYLIYYHENIWKLISWVNIHIQLLATNCFKKNTALKKTVVLKMEPSGSGSAPVNPHACGWSSTSMEPGDTGHPWDKDLLGIGNKSQVSSSLMCDCSVRFICGKRSKDVKTLFFLLGLISFGKMHWGSEGVQSQGKERWSQ